MKNNGQTIMIVAGALAVGGALYVYSRKKAEKDRTDSLVTCGMDLGFPNGLVNVSARIKEYEGNLDCTKLLAEYVEKYHPDEYQKLVSAGTLTQDQANAALEVDLQTSKMAVSSLSGLGFLTTRSF